VDSWSTFADAAPALAEAGRLLLYRTGSGEGLLATVRGDRPPRIHPIVVAISGGRLYAFVGPSAKTTDLVQDGRYALHSYPDSVVPNEFMVRGRVRVVSDAAEREPIAAGWAFETDPTWTLVELLIGSAVHGERASRDEWPPHYSSWTAEVTPAR
jgi:hypothetical protein